MFQVWGGNGDGVSGSPSIDAEQEGSGREAALGDHGPWWRAMKVQYEISKSEGGAGNCSVEGGRGRVDMYTAIRVYFLHRHIRYTVIIPEEGNLSHPR